MDKKKSINTIAWSWVVLNLGLLLVSLIGYWALRFMLPQWKLLHHIFFSSFLGHWLMSGYPGALGLVVLLARKWQGQRQRLGELFFWMLHPLAFAASIYLITRNLKKFLPSVSWQDFRWEEGFALAALGGLVYVVFYLLVTIGLGIFFYRDSRVAQA
jgi:hypothetical protein